MSVTCLLVACKAEEWQLNGKVRQPQPLRLQGRSRQQRAAVTECCCAAALLLQSLLKELARESCLLCFPYSLSDVLQCEFSVLQLLSFELIVFHPHRPLLHFLQAFSGLPSYPALLQQAWAVVNDSYYCDVALLFPPYLIAVTAVYTACHLLGLDYRAWLKSIAADSQQLLDITQQLLAHYDRRDRDEQQRLRQPDSGAPLITDALGLRLDSGLSAAMQLLHQHWEGRRRRASQHSAAGTEDRAVIAPAAEDERDGEAAAVAAAAPVPRPRPLLSMPLLPIDERRGSRERDSKRWQQPLCCRPALLS